MPPSPHTLPSQRVLYGFIVDLNGRHQHLPASFGAADSQNIHLEPPHNKHWLVTASSKRSSPCSRELVEGGLLKSPSPVPLSSLFKPHNCSHYRRWQSSGRSLHRRWERCPCCCRSQPSSSSCQNLHAACSAAAMQAATGLGMVRGMSAS